MSIIYKSEQNRMVANESSSSRPVVLEGLLTNFDYFLGTVTMCGLMLPLSVLGVVANFLNVKTFLSMGLGDSINISFLSLAVSDLLCSLITFALYVALGLTYRPNLKTDPPYISPRIPTYLFGTASVCVTTSTILTTLYIGVVRCFCVARPLQFKSVFTRTVSTCVILAINAFAIGSYMPMFVYSGFLEKFDPAHNRTQLVLWFSPNRKQIKDAIYMVIRTILPQTACAVLVFCVIIMANALLKSTKFRQKAMAGDETTSSTPPQTKLDSSDSDLEQNGNVTNVVRLSGKELQAVQQVFFICLIFVVCNIPAIVFGIASTVVPGFDGQRTERYWRLYMIAYNIQRALEQINTSVNIFFYYRYNSKFRTVLTNMFKRKT